MEHITSIDEALNWFSNPCINYKPVICKTNGVERVVNNYPEAMAFFTGLGVCGVIIVEQKESDLSNVVVHNLNFMFQNHIDALNRLEIDLDYLRVVMEDGLSPVKRIRDIDGKATILTIIEK